ncbi:AMP-binding protein [Riemerella anatipestifer]|uniref:Putative acyl--CoA ligase YhfT n=1 Tax=Riemerella anatipestifer TaxID=34085 RepID=A0A1S7DR32_RIEAN|nr:AMP-binding protein [Riemerella anatipestifer]AQY21556.1 putative acyl--CoA ligase YhfT [Riemerella anatipestifer]MCT6764069.1 AMP-binding protein [Riemerella anatipestifer]MCT6768248.1 AMP-binding protein [Riemerella anatipestifer]MCU7592766.1 AMP-binding protein [Riemerella anatipestifer]MCU7600965.1 AMP-binding protein [Riemerella anatipestifer]
MMLIDFSKEVDLKQLQPNTDFEYQVLNFLEDWYSEKLCVSVKTSGSTGVPKVFEVEKERMKASANMTCDFLGLNRSDKALLCLPVEYISGKMMLVRAMERGLKLLIKTPSINPLEDLDEEVDFCAMTPLQVEYSLGKIDLIKKLIIGGAAVSESLKAKLKGVTSHIYETYGMSETLSHIALKQITPNEELDFKPLQNIFLTQDERGCLCIEAPLLTSEKLTTNDLVELKEGGVFSFLGRVDNVINSGGVKIIPEQLEDKLKKIIPNELVFTSVSDAILGEKLVLVIEGKASQETEKLLSEIVYDKPYHAPKEIVFLDEIPRTPNGKVNRVELRKRL